MAYTVKSLIEAVSAGDISAEDARPIFVKIVSRPKLTAFPKGTAEWYNDNDGWGDDDDISAALLVGAVVSGRITDAQHDAILYDSSSPEGAT